MRDRARTLAEDTAELLNALGPIEVTRFFGGYGLRHNGFQFGIVMRDRLYLRVNDVLRRELTARGGQPFTYIAAGREVTVARYISVPDGLLDDVETLGAFARVSVGR